MSGARRKIGLAGLVSLPLSGCLDAATDPGRAWAGDEALDHEDGVSDDPAEEGETDDATTGADDEDPVANAGARPVFQLPVPCGQVWTTSTHGGHSSQFMVDMIATSGGTFGTPALASAAGQVVTASFFSDAGNMVVLDHGGGWKTRYLHLDTMDVGVGQHVDAGQPLGRVGNTGASTGAHLHYEQKADGVVVQAAFDGQTIPVKWSYHQHSETSRNCGQDSLAPYGKIGEKWQALGGDGSVVGKPIRAEDDALFGGRFQDFEHGMIIWHPDRAPNAWAVHGRIFEAYRESGSEDVWGFPTMDELDAAAGPDGTKGRYQYFEDGLWLWSAQTDAHPIAGPIHDAFVDAGREQVLGYPLGPAEPEGVDGLVQSFQAAVIHWSPATGASVQ